MRKQILDEIFGRMADHAEPDKTATPKRSPTSRFWIAPRTRAAATTTMRWCSRTASARLGIAIEREANVTIKVDPVSFLKLASNQANGPSLFMTGKLKLEGDVMLASG